MHVQSQFSQVPKLCIFRQFKGLKATENKEIVRFPNSTFVAAHICNARSTSGRGIRFQRSPLRFTSDYNFNLYRCSIHFQQALPAAVGLH